MLENKRLSVAEYQVDLLSFYGHVKLIFKHAYEHFRPYQEASVSTSKKGSEK